MVLNKWKCVFWEKINSALLKRNFFCIKEKLAKKEKHFYLQKFSFRILHRHVILCIFEMSFYIFYNSAQYYVTDLYFFSNIYYKYLFYGRLPFYTKFYREIKYLFRNHQWINLFVIHVYNFALLYTTFITLILIREIYHYIHILNI